jgi:hypothetical protein
MLVRDQRQGGDIVISARGISSHSETLTFPSQGPIYNSMIRLTK